MNDVWKDPVCGMTVLAEKGLATLYGGQTVHFCSEYCRNKFLAQPERHFAALVSPSFDEAKEHRRVAYFSMEVAVGSSMPTYSGGLGVLAGDTLKSCADLRVPVAGVTLLFRKGYFDQRLDEGGGQQERPVEWNPAHFLQPLSEMVQVEIEQRSVRVRAWQYNIVGLSGYVVPLVLLDTNVEGNDDADRSLTDYLYGGDQKYRLAQEIVLGIGGVRMLRALGYGGIEKFHLNEGHASLLVLELLRGRKDAQPDGTDFERVRNQCVFTTHTPVPAGHDKFGYDLVEDVLGQVVPFEVLQMLGGEDRLNMTLLALNLSRYVNGVAKRHEEVSREMFPGYPINHITNGVHSWTWTCDGFKTLYDRYIPGWANDPAMLRKALSLPKDEVWAAHAEAKDRLLLVVKERTGIALSADALTIGFARRATQYKRADLLFSDVQRLLDMVRRGYPLQFVFAGKAHPRDDGGKELIRRIVAVARQTGDQIPIVYLENYDMDLARQIVSGSDLWLNTPQRPLEASGTSGMKAAHNGVPSFSTLDGWWIEGCLEGQTGWAIGGQEAGAADDDSINRRDAEDLYQKLENVVAPLFYQQRQRWLDVMRQAIALNASYFNTHRMAQQYVTNAYLS
jgi:starch phosphorylase